MPDAFCQVLPAFTTRETIPSYIPKREVSRRGQMNSKSMLSILYSSSVIVQLATFVFLYWLSCSIFFSMASLQGSVLYLMCVFLKKKKQKKMTTSVYCRCLCQVHLVGLVRLPPFLFFRPGFFLLCSRFMMTHWKHCLLLWRVDAAVSDEITLIVHMRNKCSLDDMQTTVGVFRKSFVSCNELFFS